METTYKTGERVRVSPTATGLGEWLTGFVTESSIFMSTEFVSIRYDKPDSNGNREIVITNINLIEKL